MAYPHRPRAKAEDRDSGFDVWIPAGVAIVAALYLLSAAHAAEPTNGPRTLYDPARFTADAVQHEAADAAEANAPAHNYMQPSVIVAPLAPLAEPAAPAMPAVLLSAAPTGNPDTGALTRLGVAGGIAGLLVIALTALRRTWKRQSPLAI